tara:strand:+ start:109 stop:561 length:453 start_codon:yes stop_codon:yes gene_type:complete
MESRFDSRLFDLIPHRPPMLLINQVVSVDATSSSALVTVDHLSPFFEKDKGVPTWIGLEYMGQTAALIAGYQLQQGLVGPHLGFLLGTRAFKTECDYFTPGTLKVTCTEKALVGDGLATFDCMIENHSKELQTSPPLATASLSVFRRQIN